VTVVTAAKAAKATVVTAAEEYKYISCVPGVDGKIYPEGVVQHGR